MKKQYIIPEMEVVTIETQKMLAASQLGIGDSSLDAGNALAPELPSGFELPDLTTQEELLDVPGL